MDHDVFTCECHETCSLCCEPWPFKSLKPFGEWEHVCPDCRGLS